MLLQLHRILMQTCSPVWHFHLLSPCHQLLARHLPCQTHSIHIRISPLLLRYRHSRNTKPLKPNHNGMGIHNPKPPNILHPIRPRHPNTNHTTPGLLPNTILMVNLTNLHNNNNTDNTLLLPILSSTLASLRSHPGRTNILDDSKALSLVICLLY